ncbi:MAG: 30S ribosomal protein S6 [Thermodesulfobacteriota bacterium]
MKIRRYETLLLLSPDLAPEELEQIKQKQTDIIARMQGRIIRGEDWGRRRLAYPVSRQMYGLYLLYDYMGSPELLAEFERNLYIEERVYKYLTLVLDKNFSEEKCEKELERIQAENAKREAERAQREAERSQREASLEEEGSADDTGIRDDRPTKPTRYGLAEEDGESAQDFDDAHSEDIEGETDEE